HGRCRHRRGGRRRHRARTAGPPLVLLARREALARRAGTRRVEVRTVRVLPPAQARAIEPPRPSYDQARAAERETEGSFPRPREAAYAREMPLPGPVAWAGEIPSCCCPHVPVVPPPPGPPPGRPVR